MRVAIVSLNARAGDAIGLQLVEKVAAFLDRGFHVRVVLNDARRAHPALRPYVVLCQDVEPSGPAWKTLINSDLVVVEYSQYYPLLELVPLLADGRRRILIVYHGVTPPRWSGPNQRSQLMRGEEWRSITEFADGVIVHSQFAARELTDDRPDRQIDFQKLGHVVDRTRFTPGPPKRHLKSQLKLESTRLLLFVGRLAPNKRVTTLVSALSHLRDVEPPVHAVIVGPSGHECESERLNCLELAADLGVVDRLHFLGSVDDDTLLDCYRSANAFVMPSIHEGFNIPVVEAMACGVPVIAARAGALPETVESAGLTFAPENADELATCVRRVLDEKPEAGTPKRIAFVTPRFGSCVGGAERSLSLMAQAIHDAGLEVHVFTTTLDGATEPPFAVKCFAADAADNDRRAFAATDLLLGDQRREVASATCFRNTVCSSELVSALTSGEPFDAVIVGPYATGLTRDVIARFGRRAVFVPCLHDEALAQTNAVREMFAAAGAVLFHSEEERSFAASQLGLSHPNSSIVGSWINSTRLGNANRGRRLVGTDRYVLFCGRYVAEKNLPQLCDWARRYTADRSVGFRFAFIGEGDLQIPRENWAINLGRLSDNDVNDVMAGASVLIQPSVNESLSLVALEANANGVPVLTPAQCRPTVDIIAKGRGGWIYCNEQEWSNRLDEIWNHPEVGVAAGQTGCTYVRRAFSDWNVFAERILATLGNLSNPLAEQMRHAGFAQAAKFDREQWRRDLNHVVETINDAPRAVNPTEVEMAAERETISLPSDGACVFVIRNKAGRPLVPSGPARSEVIARIRNSEGDIVGDEFLTPLPSFVLQGDAISVAVRLHCNLQPGQYLLEAGIRTHTLTSPRTEWHGVLATIAVTYSTNECEARAKTTAKPAAVRRSLDKAREIYKLPDHYVDVSTGVAARLKRWLKNKLLHNFRAAYVDEISRQQSRFNHRLLEVIDRLAVEVRTKNDGADVEALRQQLDELQLRLNKLEGRSPRARAEQQEAA